MDLDLHGVKHYQVQELVLNHVGRHKPPYKIITGNSTKMREIVSSILHEYKIDYILWKDNLGSISVL